MRKNLYFGDNTGVISDTESGSDISDILADFSVNGLAEKSNLVVLVRMDSFSDPFEIRPVFDESTQTYVDYMFTVKNVLKGVAEENESITVRVRSSQELFSDNDRCLRSGRSGLCKGIHNLAGSVIERFRFRIIFSGGVFQHVYLFFIMSAVSPSWSCHFVFRYGLIVFLDYLTADRINLKEMWWNNDNNRLWKPE